MIQNYGTGNYGDGTFGGDAPANTYGALTYGSGTYGNPTPSQTQTQNDGGWVPQIKRKRKWSEERDEQAQLRRVIEAVIDPVKAAAPDSAQLVASETEGVAVLPSSGPAVSLPLLPTVDAAKVARLIQDALQEAGIAARRVREAQLEQQAREALTVARENARRAQIRKRKQEEFLLLMT